MLQSMWLFIILKVSINRDKIDKPQKNPVQAGPGRQVRARSDPTQEAEVPPVVPHAASS